MTGVSGHAAISEDRFLAVVESICASNEDLTRLGAALLAASHLGMPSDSRSFARNLGVEHALVLRELTELGAAAILLRITERNARTQRTSYELTAAGSALAVLAISNLDRDQAALQNSPSGK